MTEVWPGRPFPLGAEWDGHGTNFSIFSEHAEGVELCLFDENGDETRIDVTGRRALNWHCYLPGVGPGQHGIAGDVIESQSEQQAEALRQQHRLTVGHAAPVRCVVAGDELKCHGDVPSDHWKATLSRAR